MLTSHCYWHVIGAYIIYSTSTENQRSGVELQLIVHHLDWQAVPEIVLEKHSRVGYKSHLLRHAARLWKVSWGESIETTELHDQIITQILIPFVILLVEAIWGLFAIAFRFCCLFLFRSASARLDASPLSYTITDSVSETHSMCAASKYGDQPLHAHTHQCTKMCIHTQQLTYGARSFSSASVSTKPRSCFSPRLDPLPFLRLCRVSLTAISLVSARSFSSLYESIKPCSCFSPRLNPLSSLRLRRVSLRAMSLVSPMSHTITYYMYIHNYTHVCTHTAVWITVQGTFLLCVRSCCSHRLSPSPCLRLRRVSLTAMSLVSPMSFTITDEWNTQHVCSEQIWYQHTHTGSRWMLGLSAESGLSTNPQKNVYSGW